MPIFSKQKVNFTPNNPLTHMCVANNRLVLAMQNKILLKIDLRNPEAPEEIDLKRFSLEAKLANMYLDPSGQHLLLAFSPKDSKNPAELLYLGPQSTGPKDVPKIKSHSITAVAWNQPIDTTTATSTAPFLLGTSKGLIFEAEISNGDVKSCKQVFDIGKGNPVVISGLEYFYQPSSNKCYILVATAKRLYQFKGFIQSRDEGPCFSNVFTDYLSIKSVEEYLEFGSQTQSLSPQSDLAVRLHILYEPNSAFPRAIGYVPEIGPMVYINVGTNGFIDDSFLKNVVRIPYPKEDEEEQFSSAHSDSIKSPKSLVLTEYHTLLLFKTAVKGLCLLDEELIFTDAFGDSDKILNIVRDPIRGSIWSFTEKKVGKYAVTDEDRNIWKIYLEKGEFDKARTYSNNDEEKLEQISMKQADSYFDHKEYEISAMYYAMTKASFEEIALKFVKIDDSSALKTFLKKKLSSLRSHEPTKVAVLVIWLIEIYLNELGALRDFGKHDTSDYNNLESEFLEFMKHSMVEDCVRKNKKAVYDLMASHGDKENLIHFTLIMKDYDEVIENNIAHGQYEAALTTLHRQKDAGLYHRFIPILLDKDPKATIDILISSGRMLNPSKLLPKFSSKLDESTAKHITRYLEHCVNSLRISEQPIHDYLVSLYVYFYTPEKLMEYLQMQGNEVNRVNYDPKHALMLCLEKNLYNAAIHLYTLMGLYEEAVGLAIQIDLELAKKTANVPQDDVEIKKKLWLKIAKHVVKEKNDIQQAMEFLQQCDLLKIEDILPFFPNFVTIDHFKDAICSSLQEYNLHIQNLKEEMEEATKSAEVIREEIQSVRNRCTVVRATDQCTLCNVPLLIRNFYVFPCGHQFHADCLLEEVYPTLSQPRKALLSDYQKKISELTVNHDVLSTGSAVISARDQIKSDIDDIVASECIYCGEIMIKLIDSPFIPEEEWDHVQKEWE